jgi:hypothetical protein
MENVDVPADKYWGSHFDDDVQREMRHSVWLRARFLSEIRA